MAALTSSARGGEEEGRSPAPPPEPRRMVPGPWTHQETSNLIDAYREKWYSLNRGPLRTCHWDEVAESVRVRCGFPELSKSSMQCRHKMEKLRKRYRTLKQKGLTDGSTWTLYKKMDAMENPSSQTPKEDSDTTENGAPNTKSLFVLMGNGKKSRTSPPPAWAAGDHHEDQPRAFRSFSSSSAARFFGLKRENSAIGELTDAIRSLGDGFIRLEHMKMEMMREMERMRMEMEKKRTKMIIESQQQIAEVFVEAICTAKKLKRMSSPDS